jgi:hypothetical protein
VREEVAPYVGLSLEERWALTRRCCEAAARMLRFHARPQCALDHVDALPESTVRALARLRCITPPTSG